MNGLTYRPVAGRGCRLGVTLLEVVLAMGILTLVSSMAFWFYASTLETTRKGTKAAYRVRLSRVVLDRIVKEIRQATVITADNRVGLRGAPEQIWLVSHRVPSRDQIGYLRRNEDPPPAEYDLTKVEYKIARHPDILHDEGYELALGLARVEVLIPRPDRVAEALRARKKAGEQADAAEREAAEREAAEDADADLVDEAELIKEGLFDEDDSGGVSLGPQIPWEELYAPDIRYLRFCYYDGNKWWDEWQVTGDSPLPQLVQVTIGYEMWPPFYEEVGDSDLREINEEFCTCMNEDPVDCVPLARDQLSTVVRVIGADPLFRSRVNRETQSLLEELNGGGGRTDRGTEYQP